MENKEKKNRRIKILFVCTGNTCRSPMAEIIFKNLCKKNGRNNIIVKSAGTDAQKDNKISSEACEALKICGERISSKNKCSIRFDNCMIGEYDWIITMTTGIADRIGRQNVNIASLDDFTNCGNIADPYMYPLEAYVKVCRDLQTALQKLYVRLIKTEAKNENYIGS